MVEQQGVGMVIQGPNCFLSPQTEACCHRYDGGWWAVGFQPSNCMKTQSVDDQHTRTIGEPQLSNTWPETDELQEQLTVQTFTDNLFLLRSQI